MLNQYFIILDLNFTGYKKKKRKITYFSFTVLNCVKIDEFRIKTKTD